MYQIGRLGLILSLYIIRKGTRELQLENVLDLTRNGKYIYHLDRYCHILKREKEIEGISQIVIEQKPERRERERGGGEREEERAFGE